MQTLFPHPKLRAAGFRRSFLFGSLLLALVLGMVCASFIADDLIRGLALSNQHPQWSLLARRFSEFGDWPWLMILGSALLAFNLKWRRYEWSRIILAMILASSLSGLASVSLRAVTGRTRPCAKSEQAFYGPRRGSQWLVGNYKFNSFPSSHTSCAVAFAFVLVVAGRRRIGTVSILVAAGVAWSRVYQDAHHFSDVIVGTILGASIAFWTWHHLMPRLPSMDELIRESRALLAGSDSA